MKVGIPKEIKTHEYRVGLTPGAVREYVAAGHSVLVETNASAKIDDTDDNYRKAGAGSYRGDRRRRCRHSCCTNGGGLGCRGHNPRPLDTPTTRAG